MKIKRLVIENFKSIERIELIEPNPFTVFVGPNGSGKSNIFEALEFLNLHEKLKFSSDVDRLFGGPNTFLSRIKRSSTFKFECQFEEFESSLTHDYRENLVNPLFGPIGLANNFDSGPNKYNENYKQFYKKFCRVFVGNERLVKLPFNDDTMLSLSANNLEKVLKRLLEDDNKKEDILEWLELFIPEFRDVEIHSESLSGRDTLLVYEQYSEKPFTRELISDGTYNIIALLTAVYQSDEPQFLCIEEPENGLNPQVAKELVHFFRLMCEDKGHYIWLNTHSQSIVSQLHPEELVVVEKKEGATQIKQFSKDDFKNWRMDEAWLTNALGGGLPW